MGDNFNDLKDKMINTLKKPFKLKRLKKTTDEITMTPQKAKN